MKVLQGYRYSVTANEEVTVTDENGLNLTCPAGQQTYFTATCDEVEVSGDAVVTQTRGHITIGSGGGGGEKIAPGEVVLGGKNGTQTILDCNILVDGSYQFYQKRYLEEIDFDFPVLTNGSSMFSDCDNMTSFSGDLPKLTNAQQMFYSCDNLTSFSSSLPLLTNGTMMFYNCLKLASFSADLPKLNSCQNMFASCRKLTTFSTDLPGLTDGNYMFAGCSGMTSFSSNLPNLTQGPYMFTSCTSLTSFSSSLPSLTNGYQLFYSCRLDLESVNRIVSTVPSYTDGSHPIHIGVDSTKVTQAQQDAANTILVGKGWTATWRRY